MSETIEKPVAASSLIQITPSTGWVAVYGEGDDEQVRPVACWGLNRQGRVVGVVSAEGVLVGAEALDGFREFVRDDDVIFYDGIGEGDDAADGDS
jgi:hypothetical protein